jgi:F-type H+-transporting ATPase subunit epsilon
MAATFHIQVATPEKLVVDADAISAQIPCKNGYIGVLPDHAALLSELGTDEFSYVTPQNEKHAFTIHEGFLEVLDNQVRILTEQAEAK